MAFLSYSVNFPMEGCNKSLSSLTFFVNTLLDHWNAAFGSGRQPSEWSNTDMAGLDRSLYGRPVSPPSGLPPQPAQLFDEAHRLVRLAQQARIQELNRRDIRRITGTPGDTRCKSGWLEADQEKSEYNPDQSLRQTYFDIDPGKGGYEYKDNTGQWKTLKKTLAIMSSDIN